MNIVENAISIDLFSLIRIGRRLKANPTVIDVHEALLCTELLALYDDILLICPHYYTITKEDFKIIEPWLDGGTSKVVFQKYNDIDNIFSSFVSSRPTPSNPFDSPNHKGLWKEGYDESLRLIMWEKENNIPCFTLFRQRPTYESNADVFNHHNICNLGGKYNNMAQALIDIRRGNSTPDFGYLTLRIPPIGLQVLKNSKIAHEIFLTALNYRDKYSYLRKHLKELRDILNDPSISPEKKRKMQKRWIKSWNSLDEVSKNYETDTINVANTANGILDAEKVALGAGVVDIVNSTKLIDRLISMFEETLSKWRIRPLHNSAQNYLKTSDLSMKKHIVKNLDRDLDSNELLEAKDMFLRINEMRSVNARIAKTNLQIVPIDTP